MAYWLLKSEPNSYSIDDLKRDRVTSWSGVRNFQARNFMRDAMKVGDLCFFYHSSTEPVGIAGVCEVVKAAHPDGTAFDPDDHHFDPKSDAKNPTWMMVDVQFKEKFKKLILLSQLRAEKTLQNMWILRKGNRLSITPVTEKEWKTIIELNHC